MNDIKELTSEEFDNIIKGKVLIQFGTSWCGPCKSVKSLLSSLTKELNDLGVEVRYCDLEENPDLQAELLINSIPVIIMFNDSAEIGRINGSTTKTEILGLTSS